MVPSTDESFETNPQYQPIRRSRRRLPRATRIWQQFAFLATSRVEGRSLTMKLGLILIVINSLALGAEPVIPQPQKTPNLGISAPNGFSTWHREQGKKVVKFEGQSATLIPPNQYQIRNFQLTKVADDESIEYTVLAPDCSLNLLTKQASSPGVFKVTTANGLYSMEGEGFLWDSSTRRLVITNRLKTILNRDVFNLRTISPATPRKT